MKCIDYNSYELSQKEKKEYILAASLLICAVLYLFYSTVVVIPAAVIIACVTIKFYAAYKAKKRKNMLVIQFRDMLYSFSASVGAGRHMAEALLEAEKNLKVLYSEDTSMIEELRLMNKRISELHEDEETLLRDLGKRSGIKDITTFTEVYYICRNTGGDLVKVIGITTQMLIDKLTIVRDIESYTAQKKFEGRVIALLTPGIIFFLNIISPGYLTPLYSGVMGRGIMTAALILTVIGSVISVKIMDVGIWDDESNKLHKRDCAEKTRKENKKAGTAEYNQRTSRFYKQISTAFKRRTCTYDRYSKNS